MSDKLNINNEMRQLDLKNRNFYDELTPEERKKFSTFILLRWASAVSMSGHSSVSNDELASFYVQVANQRVNRNFWLLNQHPKLQWQLLTTISPGARVNKHEWIAFKKKTSKNKRAELFLSLHPHISFEEAELLSNITSDAELTEQLKNLGWDDKKIKDAVKGKDNGD